MYYSRIWQQICANESSIADGSIVVVDNDGNTVCSLSHTTAVEHARQLGRTLQQLLNPTDEHQKQQQTKPPVIAILLPRSLDYVIAVLAALAAGVAFMPLDVNWPLNRITKVLQQAQPGGLVYNQQTAAAAAAAVAPAFVENLQLLDIDRCRYSCAVVVHEARHLGQQQQQQQQHEKDENLPLARTIANESSGGNDLDPLPWFYVLFTSGSTGSPQGVLGNELGFINRFNWQQQQCQQQQQHQCLRELRSDDVVMFKTSVSFVDHIWEMIASMMTGADMILITEQQQQQQQQGVGSPDPDQSAAAAAAGVAVTHRPPPSLILQADKFVDVLVQHKVTHLVLVPSVLSLLLAALSSRGDAISLKQVVSSGEMLSVTLAAAAVAALPHDCVLVNLYGSTEVSADVTYRVITHEDLQSRNKWIPAGKPVSNMAVVIAQQQQKRMQTAAAAAMLNPVLFPLPLGQEGEIWIAGPGVAAGYLTTAAAAAAAAADGSEQQRFQQLSLQMPAGSSRQQQQQRFSMAAGPGCDLDQLRSQPWTWFRSGDLGMLDQDGTLHVRGRCDHQIKISGVRVDLLEVEQVLSHHDQIAEVAVRSFDHQAGRSQDQILVAYVVLKQPTAARVTTSAVAAAAAAAPKWLQQELQQLVLDQLTAAAAPSCYMLLPLLPRSSAGKLIRSDLPKPEHRTPAYRQQQRSGQQNISEAFVMQAMLSRLPAAAAAGSSLVFEPTEDFFTVGGGTSLAAAAVAADLGIDIRLLYAYPTARSLAAAMRSGSTTAAATGNAQQQQQQQRADDHRSSNDHFLPDAKRRKIKIIPAATDHDQEDLTAPMILGDLSTMQNSNSSRNVNRQGVRIHLSSAAAAAAGTHEQSVQRADVMRSCIAAADTAVVVGAASRVQTWLLKPQTTATAAAAAAVECKAPYMAPHHHHQQQQAEKVDRECLQLHWRLHLGRCIDAPPLVLALVGHPSTAAAAANAVNQQQQQQREVLALHAFACSHSGDTVSIDIPSGKCTWKQQLAARADAGMALSPCIKYLALTTANNGHNTNIVANTVTDMSQSDIPNNMLYCLDVTSGSVLGGLGLSGEVRAGVVLDPWGIGWWVITHDKELVITTCDPQLDVITRVPLPAAGSVPVAFSRSAAAAAADRSGTAIIALLDGSLLAFLVQHPGNPRQQQQQLVQSLWSLKLSAPIFSNPVIYDSLDYVMGDSSEDYVIAAAVDGTVAAVILRSGVLIWQQKLDGHIFADLLLLPTKSLPGSSSSSSDGPQAEADAGVVPASKGDVTRASKWLVVATDAGHIAGINSSSGDKVFQIAVGGSSISAAPASRVHLADIILQQQLHRPHQQAGLTTSVTAAFESNAADETVLSSQSRSARHHDVVICSSSGDVNLIRLNPTALHSSFAAAAAATAETGGRISNKRNSLLQTSTDVSNSHVSVVAGVRLPGQVFSSPVFVGEYVLMGCRDDHLYCWKLG